MTKQEMKEKNRQDAINELLKILKPNDKLHTILRHCSRSGMQREISVIFNGENLDWYVSRILDRRRGKHNGIVVGGCGMDMGFELVYSLSRRLFPDGTKEPHGTRNGEPDCDGGYALKQAWL